MTMTKLSETACLSCGTPLNAATSMLQDAEPADGDITICFKCGHIMVFENNQPRNPTDAEMHMFAGDRRIIEVQKIRGELKTKRCSICNGPLAVGKELYAGWMDGNNAWPINKGRCCAYCNKDVVIPARLRAYYKQP